MALPYLMQLVLFQGSMFPNEAEIESQSVFFELKSIRKLITYHHNQTGEWPENLTDLANQFGQPRFQTIDLSTPYQITSTLTDKLNSAALRGQTIVFTYRMNWHCVADQTTIPDAYKPTECGGTLTTTMSAPPKVSTFYIIAFFAIIGVVIAVVFYHPTIRLLRRREFKLSTQRMVDLKKLSRLLKLAGLQQQVLDANDLSPKVWRRIYSLRASDELQKIKWFKQIWPIQDHQLKRRCIYHLKLDPEFVLNLDYFYLYMATNTHSINRIKSHLKQANIGHEAVLIWADDANLNHQLQINRSHFKQRVLIPNQQQLTQLAVPKFSRQSLVDLMVTHIPINQISPYQGKGGILKSSHFYGREHILSQMQSNPKSCFLIVGGRQLGKTSILKAYERALLSTAKQRCFYISLSDDRLLPRLSYHLKIPGYHSLTDMLQQYQQHNPEVSLTLLLDETDRFIAAEIKQDFPLLAEIRACAEQGLGQMVFAGFWDLYANAVLDYHSPIKNFAHVITVGPLEKAPARKLLTEPMHLLKQRFSNESVIDALLQQTGCRANLINLTCEFVVDQLTHQPKDIDSALIKQALKSQPLYDALQGWSNLTQDSVASALDRMLVYLTFIHQSIDLSMILEQLQQTQIQVDAEQLKQALQRLRLAHILHKKSDRYEFAVPLFSEQHSPAEANMLLQQELRTLRS